MLLCFQIPLEKLPGAVEINQVIIDEEKEKEQDIEGQLLESENEERENNVSSESGIVCPLQIKYLKLYLVNTNVYGERVCIDN